jgi:hypothetical protein
MTLTIRNWDRWQSYRKDRGQPPWIKVHRALLRDPNWVALTDAQRGQLVAIWMLAADRSGVIPASAAIVRKLFIEKGFIDGCQVDANVAPGRRQHDQPEKSREEKNAPSGATPKTEEADLYERGKAVLGNNAGGLIARLLKSKKGSIALARAAIEQASTKQDPREYIGAVIRGPAHDQINDPLAGIL